MSEWTRRKERGDRTALWLAAVALTVALGVAVIMFSMAWGEAPAPPPPQVVSLEQVQEGLTWVAEKVRPSVVFIEVEGKPSPQARAPQSPLPNMPDLPEPWKRFFFGPGGPNANPPETNPQPMIGQGSGVVIDPSGYIVTNNHVVANAAKVTVRLSDGESYRAEVKGVDKLSDLAVIKIDPKRPLPAAVLGDADKVKVGSFALAVGYPFGGSRMGGRFDEALHFEPTLTLGVISATNRQISSDMPGRPFRDLLQTDAPINPGNSGGPLVNIRGEVIGINQAIFTSGLSMGNIGVGFAIPIDARTKKIIKRLKGGEPVVRGRIGVSIEPVTEPIKHDYGVDHGVFVNDVEKGGPADKAGVKVDDVIVQWGHTKVTSPDQFVSIVQGTRPGTKMTMKVVRDRKPVTLRITVGALKPEELGQVMPQTPPKKLGLSVKPMSDEAKAKSGLEGGVVVESVDPGSDGARAGIQPGDIIFRVGGRPVSNVADYEKVTSKLKKGEPLTIRVWRNGRYLTAQIDSLSR